MAQSTIAAEPPARRPRVLVAGTFEPSFARNRVIMALLEREKLDVSVLQRSVWGATRYALVDQPRLRLLLRALRGYASLVGGLARAPRPDVILVLYPGYFDMLVVGAYARIRRIPVMFDTFISLHDTLVGDRGLRRPDSSMGRFTKLIDRVACRAATLTLADTPAHADYYAALTGVPRERFRVLWLGAQEDVFHPLPDEVPEERLVVFHGTFIPLQGLDTIIRAAKLLERDGIRFRIIGDGQERSHIDRLVGELEPTNVELTGLRPLEEIPRHIARATICLGIFGTTPKAGRVVPNKLFECIAVGAPVITGDTPAIRGAFDGEVVTVPVGEPDALANAVRELMGDDVRRRSLAEAGRAKFVRDFSESALASLLSGHIDELVPTQRDRSPR